MTHFWQELRSGFGLTADRARASSSRTNIEKDGLARADRLIWAAIAATATMVLAASLIGSFQIRLVSFITAGIACSLLIAAGWFYRTTRKDPLAAAALTSTAQIITFAMAGAPLSYIAASAALPLWDTTFMAWDRHLGFNWLGLLAFMNAHPVLHLVFAFAYSSFALQTTVVAIALAVTGHSLRLRVFIMSFVFATLVTIAISAIMPAQGAWGHLHLSGQDYPAIAPVTQSLHLPVFHGLRDGTLRRLVGDGAEGIITFPSLHTALGVLFILALWPVRKLRWIAILLNVVMIAATPIDGGHYFSDVIAGIAIAALCWMAVNRAFVPGGVRTPRLQPTFVPSIVPAVVHATAASHGTRELESSQSDTGAGAI
jgi:membrane-associated phospholipid phosphatase